MSEQILLAIDCGTQSLRALLFSLGGDLLESVRIAYTPYVSSRPGWAEQDPEVYWDSLCRACGRLRRNRGDLFERVAGVGVAAQRNSMINVDAKGGCLRPAILWLDQRKVDAGFSVRGPLARGLRRLRLGRRMAAVQSEAHGNWIRRNQPRLWEATHKYLQVSGFLNYRLTGRFVDSVASQIGHIPFNYKKQRWARSYELSARLFPVEADKLPELISPGEQLGTITTEAFNQTGIAQGTPVIACGSDKGCETLGVGVVDAGKVSLSLGTTATVQTTTDRYVEPVRFMPPYPAPIPGAYNPEVEIFRGFWMITWFKNEFAHKEVQAARTKVLPAEALLDGLLDATPPGAMGLVVQPYWGPGLMHPEGKGAMIGFGDVHTRAHVYRAIIEGLGFALYDGLERVQRRSGTRVEAAAVSGGASQSDAICRIMADIFNLPMIKGRTHETSGLGAAIVIAVGLGCFASFEEAIGAMVGVQRRFQPDRQNAALYQELYARVYQRMYKALQPLYAGIKTITGYPE